jgi:hypothetical protein
MKLEEDEENDLYKHSNSTYLTHLWKEKMTVKELV